MGVFLYVLYRLFRGFYVAIWFYISPFLAMTLQFLVPWIVIQERQTDPAA